MKRRDFIALLAASPAIQRFLAWPARAYGLQLYTVRAAMRADVERTLALVADAGYAEVEFAGYFERTPAQIHDAVAAAGLRTPSVHVGLDAMRDHLAATIDDAAVAGHEFLVLPWIPAELRSADGYRQLADDLNRAGARAAEAGVGVAYHNHDFDHDPVAGATGLELLLARTDPMLVTLQLDVFWAVRGGANPLALMDRFQDRVRMLHVKDMAADGTMVDVGAGTIDYRRILSHPETRIPHVFVEHDEPADPFASARASLRYLHSIEE